MKRFIKPKTIAILLSCSLLLGAGAPGSIPGRIQAAAKEKLSKTKLTLKKGQTKTLKVKNAKKKIKWSIVSGKKNIKLKSRKKASVKILGKKAGKARVQARGKRRLICTVTVKSAGGNSGTAKTSSKEESASRTKSPAQKTPGPTPSQSKLPPTAGTSSPAASPTVRPTATPSFDENGRSVNDVKVLQSNIEAQKKNGATVSEDLDSDQYVWSAGGNLIEVNWRGKGLKGEVCFEEKCSDVNPYGSITTLTKLDVSGNPALEVLYCGYNRLTSLDVSGDTGMTELYCYDNQLASLDVSENLILENLSCGNNPLGSLDLSRNWKLWFLWVDEAGLSSLNVSQAVNLHYLYCNGNQLSTLDVSRNECLNILECSRNQLTYLDLSKNANLVDLNCSGNRITTLDVTGCDWMQKINGSKMTCDKGVVVTGVSESIIERV